MIKTRPFLFVTVFLVLYAMVVSAEETLYISDELRVPLRSSACGTCSIVHRGLVAGTRLTLLNTENGWSNVTTTSGLTGWLPSQYLVSKPIAKERLNAAVANTRMLSEENAELKNKLTSVEQAFEAMEIQNADLVSHNSELETELLTIKKVSANAIALQEQNENLIKQNRILQSEVDVLTATRDQLSSDNTMRWFLYGGIIVLVSVLFGVILPQLRPKKRFSEWG